MVAKQGRRFKVKVVPEIADTRGCYAINKMHYHSVKLYILASFTKVSLTIPECI